MDTHLLPARRSCPTRRLLVRRQLHLTCRHPLMVHPLMVHHPLMALLQVHLSSNNTSHLIMQDTTRLMHQHLAVHPLSNLHSLKELHRFKVSLVFREAIVRPLPLPLDLLHFLVDIRPHLDRPLRSHHTVGRLSFLNKSILNNTLVNLINLPMAVGGKLMNCLT